MLSKIAFKTNKASFSQALLPLTLLAYGASQMKGNQKQNECGGILAYISTGGDSSTKNGLKFSMQHYSCLQRQPYYQCGIALVDSKTNSVKTAKFSSKGYLEKQESSP